MSSLIQLISLGVSFFYGVFFYLVNKINELMIDKKNYFIKVLVTLVFIIDVVILYIYIMYKINNGIIHPYFIVLVVLGYVVMGINYKYLKKCIKSVKLHKQFLEK